MPTSLQLARTPHIDGLLSASRVGLYAPPIGLGHREPQTDVVIPSFFGLNAECHPGRAALELWDLGVEVRQGHFCFFVTCLGEHQHEHVVDMGRLLSAIADRFNAVCVESIAFNYGARWIFGNVEEAKLPQVNIAIDAILQSRPYLIEEVTSVQCAEFDSNRRINFLGWAKGGLRGAFRLLGAKCNPYNRPSGVYGDWSELRRNFSSYVEPTLRADAATHDEFILYTKETAFASRLGDRATKIRGIEFMDEMLGRLLVYIRKPAVAVVAADHSCNIGTAGNPPEKTAYLLARIDDTGIKDDQHNGAHFSEQLATESSPDGPISIGELLDSIRHLRNANA